MQRRLPIENDNIVVAHMPFDLQKFKGPEKLLILTKQRVGGGANSGGPIFGPTPLTLKNENFTDFWVFVFF